MARLLAGAWRSGSPPAAVSQSELERCLPQLLHSGATPLGWWKLRNAPELAGSEAASRLHDGARLLAIQDSLHGHALADIVSRLNAAGITPLIYKGWSVARCYADTCLRPYGDFDLVVRPQDYARAVGALSARVARNNAEKKVTLLVDTKPQARWVDLHCELPKQYRASVAQLFARARDAQLGPGLSLLEPCDEDHLRLVVLHFLRHGGWRPLWLCDVAAMVEKIGPSFDWNVCFTDDRITADWIRAAIALAHALLGCRVEHLPADARVPVPRWLEQAVIQEWRAPYAWRFEPPARSLSLNYVLRKLQTRWPGPVRASFMRGASPFRRNTVADRAARFAVDMGKSASNVFRPEWWRGVPVQ